MKHDHNWLRYISSKSAQKSAPGNCDTIVIHKKQASEDAIVARQLLRGPVARDRVIDNATRECYTYICDVISRLGLEYNHETAQEVGRILIRNGRNMSDWNQYTQKTAPKINEEISQRIKKTG